MSETVSLAPADLYKAVADVAPAHEPGIALVLGAANLDSLLARPANLYDAETCRLLMLSEFRHGDDKARFARGAVWRARAMSRFVAIGWHEGTASLMMSDAFRVLSVYNGDYADGATIDRIAWPDDDGPLSVLRELVPFTRPPGSGFSLGPASPTPSLLRRFLHEKSGFMHLLARRYAAARSEYAEALTVELSPRSSVKVALGAALVDYVEAIETGGDPTAAIDAMDGLLAQARKLRQDDLVRDATRNLRAMRASGMTLRPYEIL